MWHRPMKWLAESQDPCVAFRWCRKRQATEQYKTRTVIQYNKTQYNKTRRIIHNIMTDNINILFIMHI